MAPRVELRPLAAEDRAQVIAWGAARDLTDAGELLAALKGGETRSDWMVEAEDEPVGLASLYDIDRPNRRGALTSFLTDPGTRRAGVGAYVEFWMLEYAFEGLRLAKLWCETLASDRPCRTLHERFGFVREARLKGHVARGERRQDVLGLGLLVADWRVRRPAMAQALRARGFEPPAPC